MDTIPSTSSDATSDSEPPRSNSLVQSVHDVVDAKLGPLSRLAGGVHVVTELPRLGVSFVLLLLLVLAAIMLDDA
jgi:hypothetical protein